MRKFIALTVVILALAFVASAQEVPQVEVFGGYSLFHFDSMNANELAAGAGVPPGTFTINQNMHGWNGAVQFNINKWLGAVADISGHYGTPVEVTGVGDIKGNVHNFLFGPQINIRGSKAKGFAHVLFGINRLGAHSEPAGFDFTDNAFGMAIGGGVDYNMTKRFGLRLGQFDYIYSKHDFGPGFDHQNNIRFSAGVMINLGDKK